MVEKEERRHRVLSDAMERIVRGESGQDPRGLVPGIHDAPYQPVRMAGHAPHSPQLYGSNGSKGFFPDRSGAYSASETEEFDFDQHTPRSQAHEYGAMDDQKRSTNRSVSFGYDEHAQVLAELDTNHEPDPRILDVTKLYSPISVREEIGAHNGPPRSGKSVFVAGTSRPLVPQKPRNHLMLSDARERIARGEAAYDKDGLVPKVREPPKICVRHASATPPPNDRHQGAAYPRAGTVNSLQYRSLSERAGSYQAPHGGRHSVWHPNQVQPDEEEEEEVEEEADEVAEEEEEVAEGEEEEYAEPVDEEAQAAPPRSGKSIFVTKKPMVVQSARKPHVRSEALDRISRGEAGYDSSGLVPYLYAPGTSFKESVRPATHKPAPSGLVGEYPRNGTTNSLQYASLCERSGSYKAPSAGRHSIWGPKQTAHPAHGRTQSFTPPPRKAEVKFAVKVTPPKSPRGAHEAPAGFALTPVNAEHAKGQRQRRSTVGSDRGPQQRERAPTVESTGAPDRVGGAPPLVVNREQTLESF